MVIPFDGESPGCILGCIETFPSCFCGLLGRRSSDERCALRMRNELQLACGWELQQLRPCGGALVKGTLKPSVFVLLLLLHCGYVFLETLVVTGHGNSVTMPRKTKVIIPPTCTPFSTPAPLKNIQCQCEHGSEGVSEANGPGYPVGIFRKGGSQHAAFGPESTWRVTV